jgi:hypothetical protein
MKRLNRMAIICMLALSTAAAIERASAATDPYALPNIPAPSKPAAPAPAQPAKPAQSTGPEKLNLASFGLSVTSPAGWTRTREPNLDTAAEWIRLSPDNSRAIAVMWINVVGYNSESLPLMHIARELQHNEHLIMSDKAVKCGSEPAVEFTSPPSEKRQPATRGTPGMNLVVGRLALHANYFYRVYYLTPTGDGPRKDFDALCDSIVWSDPVSPSKALVMRNSIVAPFPMFNLKMTLLLPDPYRFISATQAKEVYETYDFINRNIEAQVTITYGHAHEASMAMLEKSITEETAKLGVTIPPIWNNPRLTVGYTWLNQRKPDAEGKPVGPDQFIVARTNDDFYVLLQFDYPPDSDAQSYAAMAPEIAKGFAEPKLLVIPGRQ